MLAEVSVIEIVRRRQLPGQKPSSKGTVSDNGYAQLATCLEESHIIALNVESEG